MDATLAAVAVVSLLLAWAMAIVSWQRVRAERRRSDARVAGLLAEISEPPAHRGGPGAAPGHVQPMKYRAAMTAGPPAHRRRAHLEPRLPFAAPDPAGPDPARGARPAGTRAERARGYAEPRRAGRQGGARGERARGGTDIEVRVDDRVHDTGARGKRARGGADGGTAGRAAPARRLSHFRRSVLAPMPSAQAHRGYGAAAVAVATTLVAGVFLAERTPPPPDGAGAPVELLSLYHRRQGDYLAVSGSLRNPPDGRERTRLSITATAFGRTGAIVGTGQTPLPVEALPPGDETPFTISLPDADLIRRYRVSFMEDQSGLPHVDRRASDAAMPAAVGRRP